MDNNNIVSWKINMINMTSDITSVNEWLVTFDAVCIISSAFIFCTIIITPKQQSVDIIIQYIIH